jgi:spermidine synthase
MAAFPKMTEIVPPGASGEAKIEHFEVSKTASQLTAFRPGEYVQEGKYAKLVVHGQIMMSDTRMEHYTNYGAVSAARGHVFVAGLGLGMILHPMAAKKEVTKITVLEKYQGVIDLVGKTVPKKVEIVCADVFDWKPEAGTKFDVVYFDIWPDISTDNLPEIGKLHRRFKKFLIECGWMDSWCRNQLKTRRRRELKEQRDLSRWSGGRRW